MINDLTSCWRYTNTVGVNDNVFFIFSIIFYLIFCNNKVFSSVRLPGLPIFYVQKYFVDISGCDILLAFVVFNLFILSRFIFPLFFKLYITLFSCVSLHFVVTVFTIYIHQVLFTTFLKNKFLFKFFKCRISFFFLSLPLNYFFLKSAVE